jgi:hypothetical protein
MMMKRKWRRGGGGGGGIGGDETGELLHYLSQLVLVTANHFMSIVLILLV